MVCGSNLEPQFAGELGQMNAIASCCNQAATIKRLDVQTPSIGCAPRGGNMYSYCAAIWSIMGGLGGNHYFFFECFLDFSKKICSINQRPGSFPSGTPSFFPVNGMVSIVGLQLYFEP